MCKNYNKQLSVFTYINDILTEVIKTVLEWTIFFRTDYYTFTNYKEFNSVKNYYFNRQICIDNYEDTYGMTTLYIYNNCTNKVEKIEKRNKEWKQLLGLSSYRHLTKYKGTSSKSYFINKDECLYQNLKYYFKNTITNEIIVIYNNNS